MDLEELLGRVLGETGAFLLPPEAPSFLGFEDVIGQESVKKGLIRFAMNSSMIKGPNVVIVAGGVRLWQDPYVEGISRIR